MRAFDAPVCSQAQAVEAQWILRATTIRSGVLRIGASAAQEAGQAATPDGTASSALTKFEHCYIRIATHSSRTIAKLMHANRCGARSCSKSLIGTSRSLDLAHVIALPKEAVSPVR